jgi:DNA polymerase-3 subunit alpha
MKRYIKELQPTAFEDIIAMVSLYRPGPMQFIESFIRRKHGLEQVLYDHPLMENAFKETYGIPVYQEQVMQLSKDLAGFTGGEADTLRKAMGKKIAELMAKMKDKFIEGAGKNGVKPELASKIFQKLEDFAAYGFNKSHAACYASIAYRTAYLKAYYPACFMAALMNSDSGSIDRITVEVEECTRMGLKVMPPDVNESFPGFAVVKDTNMIRWGLQAIKNVGSEVAEIIVRERKHNGQFKDLADFLSRIKSHAFNRKTVEALVKCGALDRFGDRMTLVANLDELVMYNKQVQIEQERNQSSLFEMSPELGSRKLELKPAEALPKSLTLAWEKELLGLYVSAHPAGLFFDKFSQYVTDVKTVTTLADGQTVTVAGVITNAKQIFTKKKNEPMAFVRIEDPTGALETVVFPKLYVKLREKLDLEKFVVIRGKVSVRQREDSDTKEWSVLVDGLIDFTEADIPQLTRMLAAGDWQEEGLSKAGVQQLANKTTNNGLKIVVPIKPSHEFIMKLRDVLKATPGDTRVYLQVNSGGEDKNIATEYSVAATRDTIGKIAAVVGEDNVQYSA